MPLEIWPVIHLDPNQPALAFQNARIAAENGCDGIFLIQMEGRDESLCRFAKTFKENFPRLKVGVNHLSLPADESLRLNLEAGLDATWTDAPGIRGTKTTLTGELVKARLAEARGAGKNHLFFGSVAFKYQREEKLPVQAALTAIKYGMIPTTSGAGTGEAAPLAKLQMLRNGIGDAPLGIASGITPENITEQAPYLTYILVATGISKDHLTFDEGKTKDLIAAAAPFRI